MKMRFVIVTAIYTIFMKCHFCYHFITKIFAIDHPEAAEVAIEENEENPEKYEFIFMLFYCFLLSYFKSHCHPRFFAGTLKFETL